MGSKRSDSWNPTRRLSAEEWAAFVNGVPIDGDEEEPEATASAFAANCPIREATADGVPCGRCWFHCQHNICPRHGDVSEALATYRETGKLTDERKP